MTMKRAPSASPGQANTLRDFFAKQGDDADATSKRRKIAPALRSRKSSDLAGVSAVKASGLSPRSGGRAVGQSDESPVVISSDEDEDEITILDGSPAPVRKVNKLESKGLPSESTSTKLPRQSHTVPTVAQLKVAERPSAHRSPLSNFDPLPQSEAGPSKPITRSPPPIENSGEHEKLSQALEAEEEDWDEGDEEGYGMDDPKDDGGEGNDFDADPEDTDLSGLPPKGVCLGSLTSKKTPNNNGSTHAIIDIDADDDIKPQSKKTPSKAKRPLSAFFPPNPIQEAEEEDDPDESATPGKPNAFAVLMGGHKESAEWKVAEVDLKRDGKRVVGRRKAPFYKVMTGMPIAVDAFRYGSIPKVKAYFLTTVMRIRITTQTFHQAGVMDQSIVPTTMRTVETTANLIKLMLGVDAKWVHGLPWDVPYELPNTGGVMVTVLHANHCPGSSLFLFEGRQTVDAGDSVGFKSPYIGGKRIWRYLHCGDFRACPQMVLHPAIVGKKIDTCYLDTTYLNPQYCFPPQPLVIDACATLAKRSIFGQHVPAVTYAGGGKGIMGQPPDVSGIGVAKREENLADEEDVKPYLKGLEGMDTTERGRRLMDSWLVKEEEDNKEDVDIVKTKKTGRTLIVIGTYSIGKERIVKGVARAIGSKIYCDARKRGILMCQADEELHSMLTSDPVEGGIHLVPLQMIQLDRLEPYLHKLRDHFDRVLAFRPTGWTYTPPAGTESMPDINHVIRRDQSRTFTAEYLRPMRGSCRQFMIFGIPYSEHSSFFELTCFALSVPGPDVKMIATVNVGNEKSRGKMKRWFEKWQAEKQRRIKAGLGVVDYRDVTYW